MKFDKGTVIRTIILCIALINQTLIMMGKPVVEIGEAEVSTFVEAAYIVVSVLFSILAGFIAWFKNNYVTKKGMKQKEVLKENNLTNAK